MLLAVQEEGIIHDGGYYVQGDRAQEGWSKTKLHLQVTADRGAEGPAKIPGHASQAGNSCARRRLHVLHNKSLINRTAHIHER